MARHTVPLCGGSILSIRSGEIPQAFEELSSLGTERLDQIERRRANTEDRVFQGFHQDFARDQSPGSAARRELAAIKRTREFGSATRCCITSMAAPAGPAECHRRVHSQSVVGVDRTLDEQRDGRGRNGVEPGQRMGAVRSDLNFRVAQGLDQGGNGLFRDGCRVHPACRRHHRGYRRRRP